MDEIPTVFGLLLLMTLLVAVARRTSIPYPIFLVLAGLVIGVVPGLPHIELEPELVFLLILPPILVSAGFDTPVRDFRRNLRPIFLLAIGLVLFTTLGVGLAAKLLIPELPWAAAFALGAIVAPPDAIAATSIAQRLGLPGRLVTVLEGESLVNDATALIAYRVAVVAALTGAFSLPQAALNFLIVASGGVIVGLFLAWGVTRLLQLLRDPPVEVLVTFLASFAAYLLAERLGVSGVLACVALGIYTGRHNSRVMSPETRVQGTGFWESVTFLLNGLAFILIGLQLPQVVGNLEVVPWPTLLGYAVGVSLATILARIVWIFPATYLPRWLSPSLRERDPYPPWQYPAFLSWAGMRGIISLAAALALPGEFPQRDLIIFLTFAVILATLVGQGLSLPWLIRTLGLKDDGGSLREENKARLAAAKAGLERLEELAQEDWVFPDHVEDLRRRYQKYQTRYASRYRGEANEAIESKVTAFERLRRELLEAELAALVRLRDQGVINDGVLWDVQRDLDLERLRLGIGER